MANDITSTVIADLSYVKIEGAYKGQRLDRIINDTVFREAHKEDKEFQKFLKNYETSSAAYDSVLQSNTLVLSGSYNSNYNGIAVINDITKEVVVGNKGTASFGDLANTDREMALGEKVPQYFLGAKDFTVKVKEELRDDPKYSSVNDISFVGHSLGGAVSVYLRIISEGEGSYSYSTKTFEACGISCWIDRNPYVYDEFNRVSFLDEARKEFQDKYAQIASSGELKIENLVNNFDTVANLGEQIGTVKNVFSPNGLYQPNS